MKTKFLIATAILATILLVALVIATPKLQPEPPLPNPNGYDDFLKAITLLNANPPDWQRMQAVEQHVALQKLVATNQPAVDLIRKGLTKECRMTVWVVNGTNFPHLTDLSRFKAGAQTLQAASRLALIEARTNEAAALAIDCIRYGQESTRGGVLIDALVRIAINSIGLSSLRGAVDGMDIEATRKAIAALDDVAARSESAEEVFKREKKWARRGRFGPGGFFTQFIQAFLNRKALEKARQKFIQSETDILRTKVQLAAHAYELDQGKPPAAACDLVPQYLKAAPLDPATGKEMPLN